MMPVHVSKVRDYAMYPMNVLEEHERRLVNSPRETFFYVNGTRGEGSSRLLLRVSSGLTTPTLHHAITRAEVEALRNMLSEVLDDWRD